MKIYFMYFKMKENLWLTAERFCKCFFICRRHAGSLCDKWTLNTFWNGAEFLIFANMNICKTMNVCVFLDWERKHRNSQDVFNRDDEQRNAVHQKVWVSRFAVCYTPQTRSFASHFAFFLGLLLHLFSHCSIGLHRSVSPYLSF